MLPLLSAAEDRDRSSSLCRRYPVPEEIAGLAAGIGLNRSGTGPPWLLPWEFAGKVIFSSLLGFTFKQIIQTGRSAIAMKGVFGFSRKERIALSQDFKKTMKSGKRLNSKNFVVFVLKNENGFHRLGIVVKKEVGPATYRNRIKRYIREFFRLYKHQVKGSFDIVLLVKKGTSIKRYFEAEKELKRCIVS